MLSRLKPKLERLIAPLASPFVKLGVNPSVLTVAGFVLALAFGITACRVGWSAYPILLVLMVLSALVDAVDGYVARRLKRVTKLGAFLDSTLDRLSDFVYIACMVVMGITPWEWAFFLLAAAFMVSYVRARAEGLGLQMSGVGVMERGERLILIFAIYAVYPGSPLLSRLIFYALTLLTCLTVCQRIAYAARRLG